MGGGGIVIMRDEFGVFCKGIFYIYAVWGYRGEGEVNSNLSTHSHAWSTVTGKPSVFSPSTHNHTWNEITGKPSTYTPTSHNQAWSTITNKPTTFTPSSHTHDDRYQISSMENSTAIPGFEGQNIAGFMHRFSNNTGKYMSETFMTYGNYLYTQVKNNGAWTGFRKQIDNRYIEDVEYALYPTLDNARDLGGSVFRWRGAYLTNAPSITSDKNKKKDIKSLDLESITRFCNGLNPVSYKLIDGESGRTHFGLIAQEVEEAMQNANLTSMDFAGFIKDGNNYFLRYEEFIPLIIKIIQNLEKRVSDLDKNH